MSRRLRENQGAGETKWNQFKARPEKWKCWIQRGGKSGLRWSKGRKELLVLKQSAAAGPQRTRVKVYEWPPHGIRDFMVMSVRLRADSNPSLPGTAPITAHYHPPTRRLLQSSPKCCLYDDPGAALLPWFHLPVHMSVTAPPTGRTFCLHHSRRTRATDLGKERLPLIRLAELQGWGWRPQAGPARVSQVVRV